MATHGRSGERPFSSKDTVKYEVIVKTGNVMFAGTDAHVYIILEGDNRKTDKLILGDHHDNFERGMIETFMVQGANVGTIHHIILGHDNAGIGPGWFCESVEVRKYLSRQEILGHSVKYISSSFDEEGNVVKVTRYGAFVEATNGPSIGSKDVYWNIYGSVYVDVDVSKCQYVSTSYDITNYS